MPSNDITDLLGIYNVADFGFKPGATRDNRNV
jgi:hypothetical protein